MVDNNCGGSALLTTKVSPEPPPVPGLARSSYHRKGLEVDGAQRRRCSCIATATKDMWDRLFSEGYRADVSINTENGGVIYAHSSILGMASPAIRSLLKHSKRCGRQRSISILGVPHQAVQIFIRFLYSSWYDQEEMNQFVMPLLVLSHVFVIPHLKQECERQLEQGQLTTENVVDILQLALLCDAPCISLICHRFILRNFKAVGDSEGWRVMKQSHPILEKELLASVIEADSRKQERMRKLKEREMYLQLYEAMEALVHICRDGCRTIGPYDKVLKGDQAPCHFPACKRLEFLVHHFASCKMRIRGGCIRCNRMWQLLELHSHLCVEPDICRVPLCRNFKERIRQQKKKDKMKWKILVRKILRVKNITGAPLSSSAIIFFD